MRYAFCTKSLNLHDVAKLHIEHIDLSAGGRRHEPSLLAHVTALNEDGEPIFIITFYNRDKHRLLPIEVEVSKGAQWAVERQDQ